MKVIGPLMVEHRLIERMIALMQAEIDRMEKDREADVEFLADAIDFIKIYADRTHHGKEEDIFFRELVKKKLKPQHLKIMNELVEEHMWARAKVSELMHASENYQKEKQGGLNEIILLMQQIVEFYPQHIAKEDKQFFFDCLEYFTGRENDAMLDEFWEFDRMLIHEKYITLVDNLQKKAV